MVKIAKTD